MPSIEELVENTELSYMARKHFDEESVIEMKQELIDKIYDHIKNLLTEQKKKYEKI